MASHAIVVLLFRNGGQVKARKKRLNCLTQLRKVFPVFNVN